MLSRIPGDRKDKCYICQAYGYTELHHIFGGPVRSTCDKEGLTVHLCKEHHTGQYGVHSAGGVNFKDYLHQVGQETFENIRMTNGKTSEEARKEFIEKFIRSYL